MIFDWSVNIGNLVSLGVALYALAVVIVRHRDRVAAGENRAVLIENNVKAAMNALKADFDSHFSLVEQELRFHKLTASEDRLRYDQHWDDVKEMLDKIMEKLDRKADRPGLK